MATLGQRLASSSGGGGLFGGPKKSAGSLGRISAELEKALAKIEASQASSDTKAAARKKADQKGSPLSRLLGALDKLAVPQRAVVALGKEMSDSVSGEGFSPSDIVQSVRERKGVGDYVDTGNKWLDRILGFGGDVATDPLTYLTFGASAAARGSAALRLTTEELADRLAREGLEEAATRVAQRGMSAATAEELATAGAKGGFGIRVPGTGRIGRALSGGLISEKVIPLTDQGAVNALEPVLGKLHEFGHANPIAQALSKKVGSEGELKAAFRSGDPEKAIPALRTLRESRLAKGMAGHLENQSGEQLLAILRPFAKANAGDDLRMALEGGASSAEAAARLAEQGLDHTQVAGFLGDLRLRANELMGEDAIQRIDDYFPHFLSEQARETLKPRARTQPKFGKASAVEQKRLLARGESFLGEELTDHSIEEIDRIGKAVLGDDYINLFEGDPFKVLPAYVRVVAKRTGQKVLEKTLSDAGILSHRYVPLDEATERFGLTAEDIPPKAISDTIRGGTVVDDRFISALERAAQSEARAGVRKLERKLTVANRTLGEQRARIRREPDVMKRLALIQKKIDAELLIDNLKQEIKGARKTKPVPDNADELVEIHGAQHLLSGDTIADTERLAKSAVVAEAVLGQPIDYRKGVAYINAEPEQFVDLLKSGLSGWKEYAQNKIAHEEIADFLNLTSKISSKEDVGALLKFYDKAMNLWKGYAILSPGFHFRNTFGGLFNQYVDGVELGNVNKFRKAWLHPERANPEDVALVRQIQEAGIMEGGQATHEVVGHLSPTPPIPLVGKVGLPAQANPLSTEFAPFQGSRGGIHRGEKTIIPGANQVENMLRGSHAFDVMKRGGSIHDAIERVYKFHFNYDDLSNFERGVARRFVPFWTWTSRNLPLQIEMMFRNPVAYERYLQLKHNIELHTSEEDIVPSYFGEIGAIRLPFDTQGAQAYLAPDLPFLKVGQQATSVQDAAASLSPIIKTPIELWAGKQFFSDIPFKPGLFPAPTAFIPFTDTLSRFGLAKKSRTGQWLMSEKTAYTIEQALPILGRMRRLAPNEEKYQSRQAATWLSYVFGIGVRANTESQQYGEIARRAGALKSKVAELQSMGLVPAASTRRGGGTLFR